MKQQKQATFQKLAQLNIDNFESEDKEENGPDLEAGKDILDKLGID